MKLDTHKRKAASMLKVSPKKIKLNPTMLTEIKEAITKTDLRGLIRDGVIKKDQNKGISKARTRKAKVQKRKGLRKGSAHRKGSTNSRASEKETWKRKVRSQRKLIKELKDKNTIDNKSYRVLYLKVKGGYFRSRRHIKLYVEEQGLVKK